MPPSGSGLSPKAIGWALLSQAVWIPLLAIDLHDRWVAHQRDVTPPGKPLQPSPLARATPFSVNDLLGAAKPVQQLAGQANQVVGSALSQAVRGASSGVGVLLSSAGSSASSLLDRPFSVSLEAPSPARAASAALDVPGLSSLQSAHTLLGRAFSRAQLLGGSIGLADLQEGPMAPLALAERALQRSSGDPLAPLPSLWREPIRQALLKLPGAPLQLSPARAVIVPSSAVTSPVEVPLALQSDGSIDVLEPPSDPTVLREIDGWSRQQRLPARGSLQPALVLLHPLPSVAPIPRDAFGNATPVTGSSGYSAGAASANPTSAIPAATTSPLDSPAQAAVSAAHQQEASTPAAQAPIPVPIVSETAAPVATAATIPVPIMSEAPAPAP